MQARNQLTTPRLENLRTKDRVPFGVLSQIRYAAPTYRLTKRQLPPHRGRSAKFCHALRGAKHDAESKFHNGSARDLRRTAGAQAEHGKSNRRRADCAPAKHILHATSKAALPRRWGDRVSFSGVVNQGRPKLVR